MKLLTVKTPLYVTFLSFAAAVVGCFLLFNWLSAKRSQASSAEAANSSSSVPCSYNVARINGYQYVKPILNERPECESSTLAPLKVEIADYIDQQVKAGNLTRGSFYIRTFSNDGWMSVNDNEQYHPGSLIKLPMLITFMRMAEKDPSILDKKVTYNPKNVNHVQQTYEEQNLVGGKTYTVRELINFMIMYSDNTATYMLNNEMNFDIFFKAFADMGIAAPPMDVNYFNYTISPRKYSQFMESLYDATYLSIASSEYATSILARSTFKDGLLKYLPADLKVAHKFGEAGQGDQHELHECGIVYLNNNVYLVTIMTQGHDVSKLSEAVGQMSKITYGRMKQST